MASLWLQEKGNYMSIMWKKYANEECARKGTIKETLDKPSNPQD